MKEKKRKKITKNPEALLLYKNAKYAIIVLINLHVEHEIAPAHWENVELYARRVLKTITKWLLLSIELQTLFGELEMASSFNLSCQYDQNGTVSEQFPVFLSEVDDAILKAALQKWLTLQ